MDLILGLLVWVGASLLVAGMWVIADLIEHRRQRPTDEELVAAFRERVHDVFATDQDDQMLATEQDALAWGFPADWMAAERVQLFWNSRKPEVGGSV